MTLDELLNDLEVRGLISARARDLARLPCLHDRDESDIEQELILALLNAWDKYKPNRGTPAAFVNAILRSKGANLVRSQQARKRAGRPLSLDAASADDREDGRKTLDPTAQEEDPALLDLRLDVQAVLQALPPELRTVAERLLWPADRDSSADEENTGVPPELILRLAPHFRHLISKRPKE
jgi:DNA-directed RNA polymerase specialized sigma24 family protein